MINRDELGVENYELGITNYESGSPIRNSQFVIMMLVQEVEAGTGLDDKASSQGWEVTPQQKNQFWLVDPLDGTKEFVKRTAEFTVNIALIEKGKPVLGVVYLPAKDILYSAVSGQGAYKTTSFDDAVVIRSKARAFDEKWRIVGSRSHAGNIDNWLQKLGDFELIPVGSSLKFCLVAEGSAHLYPRFTPTHFWDTAAGQIIVEEAGGKVIDLQGMPVSYQNSCQSLNPWFIVSNNEFKLHDFC